jgi:hypothetical protein
MPEIPEFERIVEYSFNTKSECFVVRFLDGSSYLLNISDLPKKMQTKKPEWKDAVLNKDKTAIIVKAGSDLRQILSHVVHSRGKIL